MLYTLLVLFCRCGSHQPWSKYKATISTSIIMYNCIYVNHSLEWNSLYVWLSFDYRQPNYDDCVWFVDCTCLYIKCKIKVLVLYVLGLTSYFTKRYLLQSESYHSGAGCSQIPLLDRVPVWAHKFRLCVARPVPLSTLCLPLIPGKFVWLLWYFHEFYHNLRIEI